VNLYVFYLPNYKASHPSALYCCVSAVVRPPVLIAVRLLFCAGRKFEVVPLAWRKTITCHWCSIVKYSTSQLTNTKLFFFFAIKFLCDSRSRVYIDDTGFLSRPWHRRFLDFCVLLFLRMSLCSLSIFITSLLLPPSCT